MSNNFFHILCNEKIDIDNYDKTYRKHLRDRLQSHINVKGTSVLCLAARVGTEVKAFLDLGCFAMGIDLNPGLEKSM